MSAEYCRRPSALNKFLKNQRSEHYAGSQIAIWESRQNYNSPKGEPLSSGRGAGEDIVEGHSFQIQESIVYSVGAEKPTLGTVLYQAGVTKESVDPHYLLDYAAYYQDERLSEALRREREGALTNRWAGYLRDVRAYMKVEYGLAFEAES